MTETNVRYSKYGYCLDCDTSIPTKEAWKSHECQPESGESFNGEGERPTKQEFGLSWD